MGLLSYPGLKSLQAFPWLQEAPSSWLPWGHISPEFEAVEG